MSAALMGLWVLLAGAGPAPASRDSADFASSPVAVRQGNNVLIQFTASRQTDVAVYIENAQGQVVRHLAAGVLGSSAPEPLKPDSLAQSLVWDGRDDDDRPAADGPFKARVCLGLKATYAGMAFAEKTGPNHLTCVLGMAVGPDGRVYVIDDRAGWLYWPAYAVHVFRRDGAYEKTIKPFPSNLPLERVQAIGAFRNSRGLINPLIHRALGMTFYPYEDEPAAQMAVADGRLILTVVPSQSPPTSNPTYRGIAAHLAAIDLEGGIPNAHYAGPPLGKDLVYRGERGEGGARLASASDGKHVFLVNIGHRYYDKMYKLSKHHVVYRAPLPQMGPAEIFFGEKDNPGSDQKHLNEPVGLAADGKGHLLVADRGSNRIVALTEADGHFAGSFAVDAPEWVGVHPRTGAVYVHTGNRLVKFSGWKDPKELASADLGRIYAGLTDWRRAAQRPSFGLDASADPPVIWMGLTIGERPLQRCLDRGDGFSDFEPADCYQSPRQWRPASDPLHRLIACRIDGPVGSALHILDETTGQIRKQRLPVGLGNNQGVTSRLDRDGNVYSTAAAGGIWKSDPAGKLVPFPATADDPTLKGHIPAGSTGTTAWERDFHVDRRGDIYAKVGGESYHGLMHVAVHAPDGKLKRTAIWGVTDGSYGPRVDPRGNLYMMECVKPVGQPVPDEFTPHVTDRWVRHWYDWMYGSVVKFGPQGGNIWLTTPRKDGDKPRAEPVALPDSFRKEQVYATFRTGDCFIQGALWRYFGVAHVGDMGVWGGGEHCHCTGCDFDVDDFGRSFAPDNGRQRVTVLDANGNVILHFGGYGNQDYCGPDSYVLDPAAKFLRPRKPDDPGELASPFAEPEIGLNFIIGLAVTDRHAYVADCANRRVLRVRLDYAATQTVSLP